MPRSGAAQVGVRIRKQRTKLGYTREMLAEQLGVTPKFCADLELGHKGMSVSTLCRLSRVLNLSTDYILFGKQENDELDSIFAMLRICPSDKLPYVEKMLQAFLSALQ